MKKFLISLVLFLLAVLIGIVYMQQEGYRVVKKSDGFTIGKKLGNLDESYLDNYFITVREGSNKKSISYRTLGVTYTIPNYSVNAIVEDRSDMTPEFTLSTKPDWLDSINDNRHPTTMGHLEFEDKELVIVDAEKSNILDTDAIYNTMRLLVNSGQSQSEINLADYYIDDSDNSSLDKMLEQVELYNNFKIAYTNGYELTLKRLYNNDRLSIVDNRLICNVDRDYLKEVAGARLFTYNTVDTDMTVTTHDGKLKTLHSNTYGDYVDYSKEAEYLYNILTNLSAETQSVLNREPEMKQTAKFDLDKTYLEVSIAEQHVWYYEDGELKLDTDVVTGKPTSDRSTHMGIYEIYNKSKDAHLEKWNVDVERWMSVTYDGQGFHDASWRSAFGGTIYKTNGSHGCINTPRAKMFELYDMVQIGTPVIIY